MRLLLRRIIPGVCALVLLLPLPAAAEHAARPHTPNIHAKGHSPHASSFEGLVDGVRHINSDIAFWGHYAFDGNYDGFRVIDISDPDNPQEVVWQHCNGDQGDIIVWNNILVRSWNSKKPEARTCDGQTVAAGWEGVHVFDISDPSDPSLMASVTLPCGSHTLTVAGISAGNLIVYSNNSSSSGCVDGTRANADPVNVWDIGDNSTPGGSIEDPELLYTIVEPGIGTAGSGGRWHSAAFTWDGKVLVLGWEPGGGGLPECEQTDPAVKKSMFFYDAATGSKLGQWTLPRAQSSEENCTIHNFNIVPLRSGRYVAISGNYQAGTWVTDFTDPANPVTVAWSDPPPLGQVVDPTTGQLVNELGGAWSSYWYNNFVYESEITKGVNVFRVSDPRLAGVIRLNHLNPQTEEFSLD